MARTRRGPTPTCAQDDLRQRARPDHEPVGDRLPDRRAAVPGEDLMTGAGWAQLGVVVALLALSTPLLGRYMAKVYGGGSAPGDRVFGPVERLIYRVVGVDEDAEQRWTTYALSLLAFSFVSGVILYAQLRLQGHVPFNPDRQRAVPPALSPNTAVRFLTNTN